MIQVLDRVLADNKTKWIKIDESNYKMPEPIKVERPDPKEHTRLSVAYVPKSLRSKMGKAVRASTIENTASPNTSKLFNKTAS